MYFDENEVSTRKLISILGEPIKVGDRGFGVFFIKNYKDSNGLTIDSLKNFKGVFEIYRGGLLFRTFKSNRRVVIPLTFDGIRKAFIKKGNEIISPFPLFPMWILIQFGVSIEIARHFRVFGSEYSIEQTEITFQADDFELMIIGNGYSYNSHLGLFSNLIDNNKLRVAKPA